MKKMKNEEMTNDKDEVATVELRGILYKGLLKKPRISPQRAVKTLW